MTDKQEMIKRWSDCVREMESIVREVLDNSPTDFTAGEPWVDVAVALIEAAEALEKLSKRIGDKNG